MAWQDDIIENLKFGVVEILILKLLSTEDMYGYQIKQELLKQSNDAIVVKEGSLYGPLYRMQERGLISVRKEMVGPKRFRNYYYLEDSGKEYLSFALEKFNEIYGGAQSLINYNGDVKNESK